MKENDNVLELDELVVLHKWVDEENKVTTYYVDVEELSQIINGINI